MGGVAQIQTYADIWQKRGAEAPENRDLPRHTYAPEGILLIGNLAEIAGDRDKVRTFELFRQNLHNPRVLTFDELLDQILVYQCPRFDIPDGLTR